MKKWKCMLCGYVHEGETPPEECPLCGASSDQFEELVEEEAAESVDVDESQTDGDAEEKVEEKEVEKPKADNGPVKNGDVLFAATFTKARNLLKNVLSAELTARPLKKSLKKKRLRLPKKQLL